MPDLGDPFDRRLVVAAQIALRRRVAVRRPNTFTRSGWASDVEQPAARGLAERLRSSAARPPRGCAPAAPHAVVVHVDGPVAQEVHRADHVVEVASPQQAGHAVLGAGDEVRLDAQPQVGVLAHERAVLVEVVVRVGLPEGVAPDLERLHEAVHVF